MKLGTARMLLSDFFWLGAVGSPKGDRKRRAKKNRRPDFGVWIPPAHLMGVVRTRSALRYGEGFLEDCLMAKKARSRSVGARWSRQCAAGKACARSLRRSASVCAPWPTGLSMRRAFVSTGCRLPAASPATPGIAPTQSSSNASCVRGVHCVRRARWVNTARMPSAWRFRSARWRARRPSPRKAPARATIYRVLERHGALDATHRQRRPAPPKGWYLPDLAAAETELDSFDFIVDLKIADGPLISVLTGISLHGALSAAWIMPQPGARLTVEALLGHWREHGLPGYAQFDNDTIFQGTHRFADTVGRVSRLCLALRITPVFAPLREPDRKSVV